MPGSSMRLDRAIVGFSLCVLGLQSGALAEEEHGLRGNKLRGHKVEGPLGHAGKPGAIENVRGPQHHLHPLREEAKEEEEQGEEAKPFDRRRGLFMDVPEPDSEEFKALIDDGDSGKRALFMDIPDDEQDAHHHDAEGRRSLAVDPSGVMTQLLNAGDSVSAVLPDTSGIAQQ